ncbi:MAG: helix-turn-helix transcriptional regulator [Coprococcus sp.]|nr:helix-turn-helix transcriptional regulator [Coprococcus sp.]
MKQDISLREKVQYGTKKNPITGLHFETGEGTAYPDYFFVERHWHHYIEILYIVRGSYRFEINLQNYTLNAGDICILNSGDLHQITGEDSNTIHDAVLFDPCILAFSYGDEYQEECIQPLVEQMLMLPAIYHSKSRSNEFILADVQRLMQVAVGRNDGWYIHSKLLILEIISKIYQAGLMLPTESVQSEEERQKIQHYKSVVSYMEENYNKQITLQNLADTIPCNSQYLCRFFKDISGYSPIQYLINLRLNRACYLLEHTSKSVLEVALDCGFENVSYFIRKFKETKGCTPKEYRNSGNH